MTTCELCGCTKDHVLPVLFYDEGYGYELMQCRCDPSCEPENEVSE